MLTTSADIQTTHYAINDLEKDILFTTRERRTLHKAQTRDQSIFNKKKKAELQDAKKGYDEVKSQKPQGVKTTDEAYTEWSQLLADKKEEYESQKYDIDSMYSDILNELEEETTDQENYLDEKQERDQTQLESEKADLDNKKEARSNDIDRAKFKA